MQVPPIVVDPQAPLTISAQIAGQVKLSIAMGELRPGQALPTVVQLAKKLSVNHNTIAAVYNELIEAGYLVAQRGKGTFVALNQAIQEFPDHQHFYNLLSQAFITATQFGLNPSEFGTVAYAQAVKLSQHQVSPLKLVFVEDLHHSAHLYKALQSEIGQSISFIHWEELKSLQPKTAKKLLAVDLVITTVQYLWDVAQVVTLEQEVMTIDVKPELLLLTQISSLPRHARMLLVGQNEAYSELMKKMLEQAGISHLHLQPLAWESLQANLQLFEQVDMVCASQQVEGYVRQYSSQPEKILVFCFSLDQYNIPVLKARLSSIQSAKLMAH